MALCDNAKAFRENLTSLVGQYETSMAGGKLSTVEHAEAEEAVKLLRSYMEGVDNEDLKYVNAQGRIESISKHKQDILEENFVKSYGKHFQVTNGNSKESGIGTLISVKPEGGNIAVTYRENSVEKRYTFSLRSTGRSIDGKNGRFITLKNFEDFTGNYLEDLKELEEDSVVLNSSGESVRLDENFKVESYAHGNVEHMKNMLNRLHILGKEKADDRDLEIYKSYLDKMTPEMFNNLELYLDEAGDNSQGTATAGRIDIVVNPSEKYIGNQQSEASIYMEEVIHSMTASAMSSDNVQSTKLKRRLSHLIEQARKKVSWKDFLPKEGNSKDPVAEEHYAKWLYDYIFVDENSDYEFVAKALAVPEVGDAFAKVKVLKPSEKESPTIMDRVNDFFATVIDIISGNITLEQKTQNVHDSLVNLAFAFGEINNRASRNLAEKGGYADKIIDVLNDWDDNINLFSRRTKDKVFGDIKGIPIENMPDTLYGRVKHAAKFVGLSLVNPIHTKAMGVVASSYKLKPEGTVREIIGGMFATDSVQKIAEFLSMQSGYVDKQRNDQVDLTRKNILDKFTNPLKVPVELEDAITEVIADTELSYLFGNTTSAKDLGLSNITYTNRMLRKLLTNDEQLKTLISDVKKALKQLDPDNYNWHIAQSTGLGLFMANHIGNPEQNLNAYNIATGLKSSNVKESTPELEKAINELATLVAIQNTGPKEKAVVAEAMKGEWAGIQHVADVIEGFRINSEVTSFKGNKINMIKGYSRELFDDDIKVQVAPVEDKARMEAEGYVLQSVLSTKAGEFRVKKMALYVTESSSTTERLRGSVRLNQITHRGTTITDTTFKDGGGFNTAAIKRRAVLEINRITRESQERIALMESGKYVFSDAPFGIVPVLNEEGGIVDYRYMMNKKTKKKILKQDTRVSEVMAKSFGSLIDKEKSTSHNDKVLAAIVEDMEANWEEGSTGTDGATEYALIGPNVADSEMRKLYYMLPNSFHQYAKGTAGKVIAVRRDLMYVHFGYSHMSITNFPGLQRIAPKVVINILRMAENIWIDLIKVAKTNILIKMPNVLFGNIFSNMIYAAIRGYNPAEVAKLYTESYRDIKFYNKNVKRLQEVKNSIVEEGVKLGRYNISENSKRKISSNISKLEGEQKALNIRIEGSKIHELVLLGLDQNVEDSTNDSDRSSNNLVKAVDDKLTKAPQFVRDGLDIVFITRKTKYYKVANEFLEVSDLIARDVQNRLEQKVEKSQADGNKILPAWWLEEREKEGDYPSRKVLKGEERASFLRQAKEQRQYELVEDYIAYTKPSGRFEEYLNRIGVLMFTKYVKRIQRVILKSSAKGLLKVLLVTTLLGFLGGIPSIIDQSFIHREWYTESIGGGNVFPVYNPGEHIINVVVPSIIKPSTYGVSS